MNPKIFRAVLLVCLMDGCSNHPLPAGSGTSGMTDWEIYQRIHLGMSKSKVEKTVGMPHAPVSHGLALYGGPPVPKYDPDFSRSMPFNVVVVYSNSVVVSKELYSGYDVYIEGVYPFPLGADEKAKGLNTKRSGSNEEAGKVIH